jgi:hypothetical protein
MDPFSFRGLQVVRIVFYLDDIQYDFATIVLQKMKIIMVKLDKLAFLLLSERRFRLHNLIRIMGEKLLRIKGEHWYKLIIYRV